MAIGFHSIIIIIIRRLIAEELVSKLPRKEFSLDAKPLLAYCMLTQRVWPCCTIVRHTSYLLYPLYIVRHTSYLSYVVHRMWYVVPLYRCAVVLLYSGPDISLDAKPLLAYYTLTQRVWPCCTVVHCTLYLSYIVHYTRCTSYVVPLYGRTIVRWPWHWSTEASSIWSSWSASHWWLDLYKGPSAGFRVPFR